MHIRTYNVFSPYRLQSSHGVSISSCPKPLTSKLPFPFKLPRSHFFSTQRRSDFSSLYRAAPHHAFSPLLVSRFDMYPDFHDATVKKLNATKHDVIDVINKGVI